MEFSDKINKKGFLLIRNSLTNNEVEYARSCFNKTMVNYKNLKNFIDSVMLKNINKILNCSLVNIKYRASNNNNSTDAGTFHRDVYNYDPKINGAPNIFTFLSYLDPATMELIPYSHNLTNMSFLRGQKMRRSAVKIDMRPGDLLIFNSSLIHRGIFYKSPVENRRLIQCFDCIDSREYNFLASKILHTSCNPECNQKRAKILENLNKIKLISNIINYISYINVSKSYGNTLNLHKKINTKGTCYISSEGNQDRLKPKNTGWEKGNMYIMNKNTKDIDSNDYKTYLHYSFYVNNTIYSLIIFLILVVLITIVYKVISNAIFEHKNIKKSVKQSKIRKIKK